MQTIFEASYLALAAAFLSLSASFAIVATQRWHGVLTNDVVDGIQKFHTDPTPRVGGVPILFGLLIAWVLSSGVLANLLGVLLVASIPALAFGLAEDLSKRISAQNRLLATLASGLLACYLNDAGGLNRVDIWLLDIVLQSWPVSFAFTAFAIAGMSNAINIIDGFNGLASGAVLISLAALGLIAFQVNDLDLMRMCFILSGATLGFVVLNFPFGKIFLGDGGAYLLGFTLAWTSVLLLLRNPQVSVWAPLLACGYPVIEVVFSIWRRLQHKMHPFSPDSLHLHSLIKVRVVLKYFHQFAPNLRNAIVSPILWVFAALPAAAAAFHFRDEHLLLLYGAVSMLLYSFAYSVLERRTAVRHAQRFGFPLRPSRPSNSDVDLDESEQGPHSQQNAVNSRR
jgi:UDP-N-acetylmuramyl pentapeptide phosphotransferase/UDP-N-acetylglucosamine-1-phosphate transferase